MVVPFIGHIISGTLMILNIYFEQWDARLLWLSNVYILFGGYTLLNIAMLVELIYWIHCIHRKNYMENFQVWLHWRCNNNKAKNHDFVHSRRLGNGHDACCWFCWRTSVQSRSVLFHWMKGRIITDYKSESDWLVIHTCWQNVKIKFMLGYDGNFSVSRKEDA